MATRKRTKKQSLAEFRAWLNGVEELQPDDWAPTAEQWQLIRAKIDGIAEPKAPVAIAPAPVPANQNFNVQPVQGNPYQMTNAQAQAAHIPPPPPPSGGIPTGPVTAPTPEAARVLPPTPPAVDLAKTPAPNLDTTDGNYDSSFS